MEIFLLELDEIIKTIKIDEGNFEKFIENDILCIGKEEEIISFLKKFPDKYNNVSPCNEGQFNAIYVEKKLKILIDIIGHYYKHEQKAKYHKYDYRISYS